MKAYGKHIKFHEGSYEFTWYPASRCVFHRDKEVAGFECFNLKQARKAARHHVKTIIERR